MKRIIGKVRFVSVLVPFFLFTGCASYYKVADPHSGNIYYTQKIDNLKGGAVKLRDARNGKDVILQNSEVEEINSQMYQQGLFNQISKETAPAPAAASTETPAVAPVAEPSSVPGIAK